MAAALSLNKGAAVLSMGSAAGGSSAGRSSSGGGDLDVRSLRARRLGGRHELPELRQVVVPTGEDGSGLLAAGGGLVLLNEALELLLADLCGDALHLDNLGVDARGDVVSLLLLLKQVSEAAGHAGAGVPADLAEDDDDAARHVLAAVVAGTLDDGLRVGVAHGEALARAAAREELAARGAVEAGVADDDRLGRVEGGVGGRLDHDAPPVHPLGHVVVGVADDRVLEPINCKGAEGLPRATGEGDVELARPAAVAVAHGNLACNARADRAVRVADGDCELELIVLEDGGDDVGVGQQLVVEHGAVGVRRQVGAPLAVVLHVWQVAHKLEVEASGLVQRPVARLEQVGAAGDLRERGVTQLREHVPRLLGDEGEKVEHVLGRAGELLAQLLLLRRHADRARVGVANARHDAALGDHSDGAEAKLVGAHERGHNDVVARLEAAVDAQDDLPAQMVEQQRLVDLGQP
mmetsp:Transcript_52028/g.113312  ORF Transcript_52028/g.113312 Transcript_52028/m.113312 type:complete len:464 (+) Transcript_52028:625-2016(+)